MPPSVSQPSWFKTWVISALIAAVTWTGGKLWDTTSSAVASDIASLRSRLDTVDRSLGIAQSERVMLTERESNHYAEVQRQLTEVQKTLDRILSEVKK